MYPISIQKSQDYNIKYKKKKKNLIYTNLDRSIEFSTSDKMRYNFLYKF